MKRISLIIFLVSFFILNSLAFAHPPTDIIFKYDAKNKILSVGIAHPVKDAQKHFIKQIAIKINGDNWIDQEFSNQTNLGVQAASYAQVNLKKGDTIEVLAVCNQSGKLSKKFKVE